MARRGSKENYAFGFFWASRTVLPDILHFQSNISWTQWQAKNAVNTRFYHIIYVDYEKYLFVKQEDILRIINKWLNRYKTRNRSSDKKVVKQSIPELEISGKFREKPHLKKRSENKYHCGIFDQESNNRARIEMFRFLTDSIPALNAAIWTWTTLAASPVKVEIAGIDDSGLIDKAEDVISSLFDRLYDNRYQKFAGVECLLMEYFTSLFVTGSVAGEVVSLPGGDGIDYFYFVDTASLRYKMVDGNWRVYQDQKGRKAWFDLASTYFYGLKADSINPAGISLLQSIPFVARVEQQLVTDMHKSMHNAGYHRIHVKVVPPERLPGESQKNYIGRANNYFEKTVNMFRDFNPDDNPITWDDVQIEYIGPSSRISSSNSWYINHKAIIEDICTGTHLAPFMLGYSFGTAHNRAIFKYELVQREVRVVQQAAAGFLEWLGNLELAMKGIDARCKIGFCNDVHYGVLDRMNSEMTRVKTIIMKKDAGLIDCDEARKELETEQVI
jgi:hypothetical protein